MSACVTSIWRICYCLLLLNVLTVDRIDDALDFTTNMRKASLYATGLHMMLLAAERQLATVRSETYENERNVLHVFVSVNGLWGFSYGVVYSLKAQAARDLLAALLFSVIYALAIALMMRVRRANVAKWKGHRGTLQFSQSYQVRENVTSATYLYKCFLMYSVQAAASWFCLLLYLLFRDIYKVPMIELTFGFMFDIGIALLSTTLPFAIVTFNEKLRKQFQFFPRKSCETAENRAQSFVDFEGKQIRVEACEEASTYFNQLKEAWS
ncbi:unnamed protein product [Cylicocyclus nassatus]|uniref:Uncharacterized protein n=1 Tax=Cylicocyclus nassatus TaxID=53992 RepID=A0AA36HHD9_CYLNA|nr:unnamed protein product [Cylicocyclus nassatus]